MPFTVKLFVAETVLLLPNFGDAPGAEPGATDLVSVHSVELERRDVPTHLGRRTCVAAVDTDDV